MRRSLSASPAPIEFIGAFESAYMPAHDVDVTETTRHDARWREDLELLAACGVRRLRYPIRWHRIERTAGSFDWRSTDEVFGYLFDNGFTPIVDVCHHTSYPRWVGNFADPRFGPAYLGFVEAFARRYPEIREYTLFNEPFTTFLLCGQEGIWPPYHRGLDGMLQIAGNVFPAVTEASRMLQDLLPGSRHVYVEACEAHTAAGRRGEAMAALANDRRFFFTDLFLGRPLDPGRPFVAQVLRSGGQGLLGMKPGHVDVLGLDYYAHNQWHWSGPNEGTRTSPTPVPLAKVIISYAERYGLPCMMGETNIRGDSADRVSWLKYTLEQCEEARDAGVVMDGYCWFPFIDSCDWDSLLSRCNASIDPVGVYRIGPDMERVPSVMSTAYSKAARGLPSTALPAYRFSPPVAEWAGGFLPQMDHWDWQQPPDETDAGAADSPSTPSEDTAMPVNDLVVLSHLRWTFVWQRPQHLISRLAEGRRAWFVEEPLVADVRRPRLRYEDHGPVTRVWLEVPGPERHVGFDDVVAGRYLDDLPTLLGDGPVDVWLYTPLALELGRALRPSLLVYDVMDDLASFRHAPEELRLRQGQALKEADVVFTGGRSLHRSVLQHRAHDTHLFPSGVEPEHYAAAVRRRKPKPRPVAGYVGVVDERLDLDLLADLAAALPDWEVQIVGPVVKIDPASLPEADNLTYLGPRPYPVLPDVMAGFDVALMPFALNEATRSISPTKTLEYLAAGLPVVSTPVPDVVADYGHLVDLQEDGRGFAEACRRVRCHDPEERAHTARPLLHWQHWDTIASRMAAILAETGSRAAAAQGGDRSVVESA